MTASMRIFLVVALVLAGGFGMLRVFDGQSSDATSEPPPTSSDRPRIGADVIGAPDARRRQHRP